MKVSPTLVGLVVLGLVGAGVSWVRIRTVPAAGVPSVQLATDPVGRQPASSERARAAAATGQEAYSEALPDVTHTDAGVDLGDVRLVLSLSPRPPVVFSRIRVRVRAESTSASASADQASGSSAVLEAGQVTFEMTMPMGDHRYTLVQGQDGWMEAEVTLPLCMSGNRRWFATVEGTIGGQPRTARFRLDLTPPPT